MVSLYRDPRGEKIFTDQHTATVTMDVAAPHGRTDGSGIKTENKSTGLIINSSPSSGLLIGGSESSGSVTRNNQSDKTSGGVLVIQVKEKKENVKEKHVQTKEVSLACISMHVRMMGDHVTQLHALNTPTFKLRRVSLTRPHYHS